MMSRVIVFFANGTEEIEALTVVDLLRRAKIEVDIVTITDDKKVTGSHNITVIADKLFEEVDFDNVDMLVIPGGMPGTLNLKACDKLADMIVEFDRAKKGLAAICAAPIVLGANGVLKDKKATCYPGFEDELMAKEFVVSPVVKEGNVITSRGLGTAIEFSSAIIEYLCDKETADGILNGIIYKM